MHSKSNIRWGVKRRLEFIEFRLFWEGGVNRSDITNLFGVSTPQASKDLSLYQEMAPDNVRYDKSAKRYVATEKFKPIFMVPDADHYLAQLATITNNAVKKEETWLGELPGLDSMPIPHRRISVELLRSFLSVIRNNSSMEIYYQSMSKHRTEPLWRRVTPHAFVSDGLRWHIRAFCHIDSKFKDFLFSRCLEVRDFGESGASCDDDEKWNTFFTVTLIPNPNLGESQQKIIEHDYEMKAGVLEVPVRTALLYYFSKRLRLDVADAIDAPHEVPVIIKNNTEFKEVLAEAMS